MNSGDNQTTQIRFFGSTYIGLVNWIGKLVGCAIFEPLVEKVGYKKTIYILSCIQIVAVTSEPVLLHYQNPGGV